MGKLAASVSNGGVAREYGGIHLLKLDPRVRTPIPRVESP